jgi:thymidylate kinase
MAGPRIAVVGVCGSGKTTLVNRMRARGCDACRVLQEHSYVPDMWQRITRPDLLIYLDASLETIRVRRDDPDWPAWMFEQEVERLRHARVHCDLYIRTDMLAPEEVMARAWSLLEHPQLF